MPKAGSKPSYRGAALFVSLVILIAAPAWAATDPLLAEQWGLQRIGAQYTWGTTTGAGILLAVVDTGIDLNHPDLKSRVIEGKDFVPGQEDTDAQDEHGHGTLVAGIAGAATDNSEGISGTAPQVGLMAIRVIAANGEGYSEDAAQGIDYAVSRAKQLNRKLVVNLSFDWYAETPETNLLNAPDVVRAIKDAAKAGALVVLSSGNAGEGSTAYDEPTEGVLVVGSSDQQDRRAPFSNYGPTLSLIAPGMDVLTTYFDPSGKTPRGYAYVSGTSMSAPFVSGTAALLMSRGMSAQQAAEQIKKTARDVGPAGWDEQHGSGILDAAAAVGVPRTSPAPSPAARRQHPTPTPTLRPQTTEAPIVPSPIDPPGVPVVRVIPSPTSTTQAAGPLGSSKPLAGFALGLLLIVLDSHLLRVAAGNRRTSAI